MEDLRNLNADLATTRRGVVELPPTILARVFAHLEQRGEPYWKRQGSAQGICTPLVTPAERLLNSGGTCS